MKLALCLLIAWGQEPVFEVASIKPSQSVREGSGIHNSPGGFEAVKI
jgi:hypothetical protein